MKHSAVGRPTLPNNKKRNIKVVFYINEDESKKLESLKNSLSSHSPTLSINEFFRKVLNNYDSTLLDFLELSPIDEVKHHLKMKRIYNNSIGN